MTPDLALLLGLLVLFLLVAIGGLTFFMWRVSKVRKEADLIQKQLDTIAEETAEIQNEVERIGRFLNL